MNKRFSAVEGRDDQAAPSRRHLRAFGGLRRLVPILLLALFPFAGRADDAFPAKPITVVVPYPAGSVVDYRARQITDAAARQTGWRFVVENRPGGMGVIGASYAARAKPDGYTILAGSSSELNVVRPTG